MEKAHKLHPRAAGPFTVRKVVNPNAYNVAIPSDWGISSTFNIGDLVAYQGPLEVPTELGLSPYSTESSLSTPAENDGDHSQKDITFNGPDPITEPGADVVPEFEVDAGDERVGRPRRLAKPTTRPSEYLYF